MPGRYSPEHLDPSDDSNSKMRVWDLPPECLCDKHLLGEHAEIHALWSVITWGKKGYCSHPETLRWRGRLKALYLRHEAVSKEMARRGFNHKSFLDEELATGDMNQMEYVDSIEEQRIILKTKGCACRTEPDKTK